MTGPEAFREALTSDEVLPASRTSSSAHLGWTSALVRTYREDPDTEWVELPAVPNPAVVLVTGGVYRLESRTGTGRGSALYCSGSLGLTPPGHGNTLRWRSVSREPLSSTHVHLNPEVWDEMAALSVAPGAARTFPNRLTDSDPLVGSLVTALQQAAVRGAPALYADATSHLLCTHLLLRPTAGAPDERTVPTLSAKTLADVVAYLDEHLAQDITLDALAAVAGYSKFHFLRTFKATTGSTPFAYLTELRMRRAAVLVGRRPIEAIAHACGHQSVARFSAAFRRHHGVTPARYPPTDPDRSR